MTDLVVLICRDCPDSSHIRAATRPAHLDWVKAAPFPVAAGGPLLGDDGAMIGSLLVVQSGDADAVREWAAGDPYARAGLFESVTIAPWRNLLGVGLPAA